MSEPLDGVLVYDGDCPFCSAAASAPRRADEVDEMLDPRAEHDLPPGNSKR